MQGKKPPVIVADRRISGHVWAEHEGKAANAVVVVGQIVKVKGTTLTAEFGVTTDETGAYSIKVPSSRDLVVAAGHATAGWSKPITLTRGRGDTELNLELLSPANVRGVATYRDEGTDVRVELRRTDGSGFRLRETSTASGEFEFSMVPSGQYELQVELLHFRGEALSRTARQPIAVRPGELKDVSVELPDGTTLAAVLDYSADLTLNRATYTLLEGATNIETEEELAAALAKVRAPRSDLTLTSGLEPAKVMQFHDLDPGDYTLCVRAVMAKRRVLSCVMASVAADEPVKEVTISIQ
jgi:hypothetical protein